MLTPYQPGVAVGPAGALSLGEKEFGASGDMPFSFGVPGAGLPEDGAGAELLGVLVVVVGASLVVLLHAVSVPIPMIAALPANTASLRASPVWSTPS